MDALSQEEARKARIRARAQKLQKPRDWEDPNSNHSQGDIPERQGDGEALEIRKPGFKVYMAMWQHPKHICGFAQIIHFLANGL
jgi:hypothetical protein